MKTITLILYTASLGFAQSSPSTSTAPTTPAKAVAPTPQKKPFTPNKTPVQKAPAPALTIPDSAVQVNPNLYRYTDSSGKAWLYRKTPFGIARYEESAVSAPEPAPSKSEPTVVTDLGDSYRFERKTPFGGSSWVRKKTELTDDEKALVDHPSQPSPSGANVAGSQVVGKTKEDK
jgi:hypothetical protein